MGLSVRAKHPRCRLQGRDTNDSQSHAEYERTSSSNADERQLDSGDVATALQTPNVTAIGQRNRRRREGFALDLSPPKGIAIGDGRVFGNEPERAALAG